VARLALLVALGATAGAATAAFAATAPDTKQMVLRLQDAPAGFERTKGRYVSNKQAAAETQVPKDYVKLGRITGYEAEFQKGGLVGLLQITSSSSTYKTARGAHDSLLGSAAGAEKATPRFRRLALGGSLGHEARLYKTTITNNGTKIDVVSLIWRYKNIYSALFTGGISGSFDPAVVVALGRKQQARILKAAG
jgi:hypothetical protein